MLHCHVRYTVTFVTQTRLKRSVSGDVLARPEMPDHFGERACRECCTVKFVTLSRSLHCHVRYSDSVKAKCFRRYTEAD